MNIIERVARAICFEQGIPPNDRHVYLNDHQRDVKEWELWIDEAKAAIRAMRKPTQDMKNKVWVTIDQYDKAKKSYQEFIDAALGEDE